LPAGAAGEICIRGTCLSPGYWNNPQRTAEKFVLAPSPRCHGDRLYRTGDIGFVDANGDLRFVGRLDDQVKFMGHRIELGEITRAILSLDYVLDAAVLLVARPSISTDLIAAFVEFSKGATEGRLVSDLRDLLPAYMIPRLVVPVQSLPRTDRGKVDFAHLRLLAAERDIPWQSDGPDHSS
jgi:acyl-coenzyme A synthetase/AMP-(fatty) acid ligase